MTEQTTPVITIDGLSGSGKGTIGLMTANVLGWHYLDSGVFYRLLALAADQKAIPLNDEASLAKLASQLYPDLRIDRTVDVLKLTVMWEGQVVTERLRQEVYGLKAAEVGSYAAVRAALLSVQRNFRKLPGLVADGRDMGGVIFPDATIKFFLTADIEVRSKRRYAQLKQQGNYASLDEIREAIVNRDTSDQLRLARTLKAMPDSYAIDTSNLSIGQVMAAIRQRLSKESLLFH